LHDDEHQRSFERTGYAIVDLLGPDEVAELQRRYDLLEHRHQTTSPWVDGFETTLYDDRPDHRAQVLRDVEDVMGPALERALVDHRIMFANHVVKLPGSAAVPPHADWTFLDEDRFSSATVWVPLVDTSLELRNGALGVSVGSQDRIDFVRIANVASYDRCVDAVADLPRSTPALRAGQAIVMDNRVVHFSAPNETATTRVAVGCVVGPVEAELRHYWLDADDSLIRFTVDPRFYLGYEIGQPVGTDGVLATETVAEEPVSAPR
jgi:hypothetical protein